MSEERGDGKSLPRFRAVAARKGTMARSELTLPPK